MFMHVTDTLKLIIFKFYVVDKIFKFFDFDIKIIKIVKILNFIFLLKLIFEKNLKKNKILNKILNFIFIKIIVQQDLNLLHLLLQLITVILMGI